MVDVRFDLEFLLSRQEVITDDPDAVLVLLPHVRVLVDVAVDTQHVEVHVDGQDVVASQQVESCLQLLPLELILEEFTPSVNEIYRILVLGLLREDLHVQKYKFLVKFEAWLLHELKHQQVGDIENLGLELEIEADEVHALHSPLRVELQLVSLVQRQGLVLLLQELAFSNIGEKEVLTQVLLPRKEAVYVL